MAFERAKWIWIAPKGGVNEYGEFFTSFTADGQTETVCRLSCDGDYTLFVNGKFVASNQYGDFEHYKIYDEIDITPFLQSGENKLAVLVWHFGADTQRYLRAQAGLIFEVAQGEKLLIASGENTLCRRSKTYLNGYLKTVTPQIGFSFLYDATNEDSWTTTGEDCKPATVVEKNCAFFPRPIQKLQLLDRVNATVLEGEDTHFLVDLGEETVGLATLEFFSETEQTIRVDWGEDLQDGRVRRLISNRDFSFEYVAKKGKNEYTNYMLRLGGRYMEIYAEEPIALSYVGVIPQVYPVQTKTARLENALDQKIYDTCVNTLRLCLMEHYVDTPWREQCLYAFDSRNQILCGYDAFEGGNVEYARANLKLMSEDKREDGLLAITYPCGTDLTIPSFSLYYFMAVREYLDRTGDIAFAKEVYCKLLSLVEVFLSNRQNGLICKFEGVNHWNFYDWSDNLSGALHGTEEKAPDLMINLLFIVALENLQKIALKTGETFEYESVLAEVKTATKRAFYRAEKGVYSLTADGEIYTALGNAFAVLSGVADDKESKTICEKITTDELTDCSLSMKTFKYDALLKTDEEAYREWVLNEIRKEYKVMIDAGSTSVWETIEGAAAFDNAGSLCHGWSAIPVYYYHKLKMVR